ncbi:MAG: hypothetical protein IT307_20370 [Chloroflexi bacterium]|nr:hypothetical protein [Chloroflexota bacterium]
MLPTATGKTVVACMTLEQVSARTLVSVLTIELPRQWREGPVEKTGMPPGPTGMLGTCDAGPRGRPGGRGWPLPDLLVLSRDGGLLLQGVRYEAPAASLAWIAEVGTRGRPLVFVGTRRSIGALRAVGARVIGLAEPDGRVMWAAMASLVSSTEPSGHRLAWSTARGGTGPAPKPLLRGQFARRV